VLARLRRKNLHQWLPDYGRHLLRRARTPTPTGDRHVLFALCDHYEPLHGKVSSDQGMARVEAWRTRYPSLARAFRDARLQRIGGGTDEIMNEVIAKRLGLDRGSA